MNPAHVIGIFALIVLPAIVALVRDREAQREADEMTDEWMKGQRRPEEKQ